MEGTRSIEVYMSRACLQAFSVVPRAQHPTPVRALRSLAGPMASFLGNPSASGSGSNTPIGAKKGAGTAGAANPNGLT
eukprot:3505523-Alexandrium_andersonii.AAC.1